MLGTMGGGLLALWPQPCLAQGAELEQPPRALSQLTLDVSEPGVLVEVDGAVRGVTPLEGPLDLPGGKHQLSLAKVGFVTLREEVELAAGPQRLAFQLRPRSSSARMSVGATLLPAELWLDGEQVGPLPWSGEVPPGEHVLAARGPAAVSEERRVSVLDGENVVVTLSLLPRRGPLLIEVQHASIYVDEAWMGVGRFDGSVPVGKHRIRLKRIGFTSKEYDVDLAPEETWRLSDVSFGEGAAAGAPEPPRRDSWRGVYGQVGLFGWFSAKPTDELRRECPPARASGSCDWYPSYGGGLALRAGYSFGWLAVEGLVAGLADAWYDQLRYDVEQSSQQSAFYGPARSERYTFARYGGAFGLGARVLTPTQGVRGTFGLTFGFVTRVERYFRVSSTSSNVTTPLGTATIPDARAETSGSDSQASPLLLADLGVLFGSTPGLKFQLGLLLAATFGSSTEAPARRGSLGRDAAGQPLPFGSAAIDISRGSQLFFGPILGVQLGH